jgi:hypothetical protein
VSCKKTNIVTYSDDERRIPHGSAKDRGVPERSSQGERNYAGTAG